MTLIKFSYPIKVILISAFLLSLSIGNAAWAGEWNLKDKDGAEYTLSGLRGKWVLVNFWAAWCPSCIKEMPEFIKLHQQHNNLQVIGVAVFYQSHKEVVNIVAKQSISYPIVFGNENTADDFGGLDGMPTSFLYSPSGKLVGRHRGPLTKNQIEQVIDQKPSAATLFTREIL